MRHAVQARQRTILMELGKLSHKRITLEEELKVTIKMIRQLEGAKYENEQALQDWAAFEKAETVKPEDVTIADTGEKLSAVIAEAKASEAAKP